MSCTVIASTIVHWIFPYPVTRLTADSNAHKASHTTGLTSAQISNWLLNVQAFVPYSNVENSKHMILLIYFPRFNILFIQILEKL